MAVNAEITLDAVDARLVALLQRDGRMSMASLARAVSMSTSAAADRVRRLTDVGVIVGYQVLADAGRVGLPVRAFIRVRLAPGASEGFVATARDLDQVLAAHHVTGEDCYLVEAVASSMADLETLAGRLALFGHVTTNVVFSSPVPSRPVPVRASGA